MGELCTFPQLLRRRRKIYISISSVVCVEKYGMGGLYVGFTWGVAMDGRYTSVELIEWTVERRLEEIQALIGRLEIIERRRVYG